MTDSESVWRVAVGCHCHLALWGQQRKSWVTGVSQGIPCICLGSERCTASWLSWLKLNSSCSPSQEPGDVCPG